MRLQRNSFLVSGRCSTSYLKGFSAVDMSWEFQTENLLHDLVYCSRKWWNLSVFIVAWQLIYTHKFNGNIYGTWRKKQLLQGISISWVCWPSQPQKSNNTIGEICHSRKFLGASGITKHWGAEAWVQKNSRKKNIVHVVERPHPLANERSVTLYLYSILTKKKNLVFFEELLNTVR